MALKGGHENKNMDTRRTTTNTCREGNILPLNSTHPKRTRLIPQQLEEKRIKVLCFSYDSKYGKAHKCSENKLFYIDCEKEDDPKLDQP